MSLAFNCFREFRSSSQSFSVPSRIGRYRRRSIRLWEYDYRRDGAYFVTICSHDRVPRFGSTINGHVVLSDIGRIVRECWDDIPNHFPYTCLDRFVVMPDHVHGILVIQRHRDEPIAPGTPYRSFGESLPGSLATIIGAFKSTVTRRVRQAGMAERVWQRNYYEHVIRDDRALWAIRRYIVTNPTRWHSPPMHHGHGNT